MLDKTDAEVVREWLSHAFGPEKKKARTKQAELAAFVGVSPQAVNGWIKTGRITKTNLTKAVQFLGFGPDFATRSGLSAQSTPSLGNWPFRRISRSRWEALHVDDRSHIETIVEREVAFLEKRSEQSGPAPAAA